MLRNCWNARRQMAKRRRTRLAMPNIVRVVNHNAIGLKQWKTCRLKVMNLSFTTWLSDGRIIVWLDAWRTLLPECMVPNVRFGVGLSFVSTSFSSFSLGLSLNLQSHSPAHSYFQLGDCHP